MNATVSDRRTQYTHSTAGLLFGLFGGVVSAFFTYLVTITPTGVFVLDPGATPAMFADLTRLAELSPPRWPLVVLAPVLPILELMVAALCSLSAARHVGVSLITRVRLLWICLFGAILALGVLTTETAAQQAHWSGLVILLVALSLPHHPDAPTSTP
jgi:hypothetical protein